MKQPETASPETTSPETAAIPTATDGLAEGLRRELAWVLAINTAIAGFLSVLVFRGNGFLVNLVFSHSIGLAIYLLVAVLRRQLPQRWSWASWVLGVPVGFAMGISLAALLLDLPLLAVWRSMLRTWAQALAVSAVCTLLAGYFFWSRERIATERAVAERERALALMREKQALQAQLKALQAQIEPHFLFNTLANVVSLIERDGRLARRMLEDLIDFLRSSLAESRTRETTLGRQMALLEVYLRILEIRMGARLKFHLAIAPGLEDAPLPPMLLQPLVENAVKHGLEPKIEGGEIVVSALREGEQLCLSVADTGLGLGASQGGTGVGLANVRERIATLYGDRASLTLAANQPCGLQVTLRLPLENPVSAPAGPPQGRATQPPERAPPANRTHPLP
ncbi:partial Sensor histidine kinase BtsS, partial [Myxococcaceae bacterium]